MVACRICLFQIQHCKCTICNTPWTTIFLPLSSSVESCLRQPYKKLILFERNVCYIILAFSLKCMGRAGFGSDLGSCDVFTVFGMVRCSHIMLWDWLAGGVALGCLRDSKDNLTCWSPAVVDNLTWIWSIWCLELPEKQILLLLKATWSIKVNMTWKRRKSQRPV